MAATVPLNRTGSRDENEGMRWLWLLALLAVAAVAIVWSAGGEIETVGGAQATTSTVVAPTVPVPATFPIPLPDLPPLPGGPPAPPPGVGGGEVLNIHSRVVPFTPGQTSWTSRSTPIAITVRTDKPAPKAGEPVTFEVEVTTTTQACCGVVLRPGGDASFEAGGGLACLPTEAPGTLTATFRWVHVYESSGRFTFSVLARAGTCSQPPETGGLTGLIEVV
jgi:hypothetical protein